MAATSPKVMVSEAYTADGLTGVAAASATLAAKPIAERSSKYIQDVTIAAATGVITVTTAAAATSGLPADAAVRTILFTPNVQNAPLAGLTGAIDWACSTTTFATATSRGLTGMVAGTLPSKYAPAECR